MLERIRSLVVGLSLVVVAAGLAIYFLVQIGGGDSLFGSKDGNLQSTDFVTLSYAPEQNGYLLCNADLCRNATADGNGEIFLRPVSDLRKAVADLADSLPTVKTLKFDLVNNQFEFSERLPGQTFPAVVSVRIDEAAPYTSTLSIYSYQPVGDSTPADHRDRVIRWIQMLKTSLNR